VLRSGRTANLVKFVHHTATADHPDLSVRKRFLARLYIALDMRMHHATRTEAMTRRLEPVIARGLFHANDASPDSENLDHFLANVREQVLLKVREDGLESHHAIAAFTGNMSTSCENCARICGGMVCSGGIFDRATLTTGGYCWKPMQILFEKLCEWAEEFYQHVPSMQNAELRIDFATQVAKSLKVEGATRFPAEDAIWARRASVTIDLPDDLFDESHLGALPYVMFHEIFVHGPESWGAIKPRVPSDEFNAFREGFLDRAAFLALKQKLDEGESLPEPFHHATAAIATQADAAHMARLDLGALVGHGGRAVDHHRGYIRARQRGRERFEEWLRTHGLARTMRIATYLNTLPLSLDQQATFLSLIEFAALGADWSSLVLNRQGFMAPVSELEAAVERDDGAAVIDLLDRAVDEDDF